MLTAAVVSSDLTSSGLMRAALQQSGLVQSVKEWSFTPPFRLGPRETVPDVILLDLDDDAGVSLAIAADLRRMRPTVRIVACARGLHPDPELLLKAMRNGVQDFIPKPVDPTLLHEILLRFVQESEAARVSTGEKVILCLGSKGGVGTTTVAVNLGVQLAQVSKKRVVLLDFGRPVGHASLLLDIQPSFAMADAVQNLDHLDSHLFDGMLAKHRTGLEVLGGVSHPEEWEGISPATLRRVVNVGLTSHDLLLVDGGVCGLTDWESILHSVRALVFVAEPNVPALWGLDRKLEELTAVGLSPERVRILMNRWQRGDEDALRNVEKTFKYPIFARIPNDFQQVSKAQNLGIPLSGNHSNPLVTKFRELACQLAGIRHVEEEKRGLFSSFLSFPARRNEV